MSTKRKLLVQPAIRQSAKSMSKGNLDESRTVVLGGGNAAPIKPKTNGTSEVVDISSDESASDSASDEDDHESGDEEDLDEDSEKEDDTTMKDLATEPLSQAEDDDEANAEPSFGELVHAHQPADASPIDVATAFQDPSTSHALTYPPSSRIQPPSGASLGTVLTQALRTNDIALLESCLHTTDVNTIRATIQRLQSPLAGMLLQKLAERLHKRPGRAGSLMVWVQWTLVTHGGFLATQRDLISKLADLNRVIDERAKGLQSLLSLKGKLDMLEAQMELRRTMQSQRRRGEEDDDEDGVIYVEGEDSDDEDGEDAQKAAVNGISDADSEISGDMPMTNGKIADTEDSEAEESSEDEQLLDDEAEETDADTDDEDDIDHDDMDSNGEDDDSDEGVAAAPAAKRRR